MNLFLRKANIMDCDLLFNWANDEDVRKNSFNQSKILYENHVIWFKNTIELNKCIIFILYSYNTPVGQVRIDIEGNCGIIDYSIDKMNRGKGYGVEILHILEKTIINEKISIIKLIGNVKYNNIKSQRVFEKNNYKMILEEEYFLYSKEI